MYNINNVIITNKYMRKYPLYTQYIINEVVKKYDFSKKYILKFIRVCLISKISIKSQDIIMHQFTNSSSKIAYCLKKRDNHL